MQITSYYTADLIAGLKLTIIKVVIKKAVSSFIQPVTGQFKVLVSQCLIIILLYE